MTCCIRATCTDILLQILLRSIFSIAGVRLVRSLWPCRLGPPWTLWSGSGRRSAPGSSPWRRSKSCHRRRSSCWCSPSAARSPRNLPLCTHTHTHTQTSHAGSNTDPLAAKEVSPWKLNMELLSVIELLRLSQLQLQCGAVFWCDFHSRGQSDFCCKSKTFDEIKKNHAGLSMGFWSA